MYFWIDIEDGSGTKYGSGPIVSAEHWEYKPALSRAGQFSFVMPAGDLKAALVQKKRIARCYALRNGLVEDRGSGIIDRIAYKAGNPSMLTVGGDNLLRELTYRTVAEHQNVSETQVPPYKVESTAPSATMTNAYDEDDGTYHELTMGGTETATPTTSLYVEFDAPVGNVYFYLSQVNTEAGFMHSVAIYRDSGTWDDIAKVDGTDCFRQSGQISWEIPDDWATGGRTAGKYAIRFLVRKDTSAIRFAEVYASVPAPSPTDIDELMDYAPAGWSLDTTNFHGATANGTYSQFAYETVLAALVLTAEHTGEHFRLGTGRQVQWMRNETPDSGVRLVGPYFDPVNVEDNESVALVTNLEEIEDSYAEVTRIYPFGTGNGAARLTLAETSETAPTGYTLNAALNYIEVDGATTRIDRAHVFSEIGPITRDSEGIEQAANDLFNAALTWLQANQGAKFYHLSGVKVDQALNPGDQVRLVWREVVDGYVIRDIDQNVTILSAAQRLSAAGVQTYELDVSTVNRHPVTDQDALVDEMVRLSAYRAHTQPIAESQIVYEI